MCPLVGSVVPVASEMVSTGEAFVLATTLKCLSKGKLNVNVCRKNVDVRKAHNHCSYFLMNFYEK